MSYSDFILGNKVILSSCLFATGKKNPVQKKPVLLHNGVQFERIPSF